MDKGHDVAPGERQFHFLWEVLGRLSNQHKNTGSFDFPLRCQLQMTGGSRLNVRLRYKTAAIPL